MITVLTVTGNRTDPACFGEKYHGWRVRLSPYFKGLFSPLPRAKEKLGLIIFARSLLGFHWQLSGVTHNECTEVGL